MTDQTLSDTLSALEKEATARPEGHCADDKAWLEFSRQCAGQPRSYGDMTDFALANAVFMASRDDLSLIHYQTAAKERIRWLSIRLAAALREREGLIETLRKIAGSAGLNGERGTTGDGHQQAIQAARQALENGQ